MRAILNLLYLVVTGGMVFVGLRWPELSPGLAAGGGEAPFYCKNARSAGGEDDAMLLLFVIFAAPLVWRLLRWQRGVRRVECVGLAVAVAMGIWALWLASLDCAQVFYTAFTLGDVALIAVLAGMPLSVLLLGLRALAGKTG